MWLRVAPEVQLGCNTKPVVRDESTYNCVVGIVTHLGRTSSILGSRGAIMDAVAYGVSCSSPRRRATCRAGRAADVHRQRRPIAVGPHTPANTFRQHSSGISRGRRLGIGVVTDLPLRLERLAALTVQPDHAVETRKLSTPVHRNVTIVVGRGTTQRAAVNAVVAALRDHPEIAALSAPAPNLG